MKIDKIGSRGVFFTYEDGDAPISGNTSIYLINSEKRVFICDTHMGPISMKTIKKYLRDNGWDNKEIILFNSHSDWDHIWGNCAFEDVTIISHARARKRMQERGKYDLERLSRFHNGTIELKLPNLTFDSKIRFEEDEIEFIYAPGHTIDSSICLDRRDSVVFTGDLIEYPLPIFNHYDMQAYLNTLESIRSCSAEIILSAHSGIVNERLLRDNIDYIKGLLRLDTELSCQKDEEWQSVHSYNVKNIMFLRYMDIVKQKSGDRFDHKSFKKDFWSFVDAGYDNLDMEYSYFTNTEYDKLEETLISYISKL